MYTWFCQNLVYFANTRDPDYLKHALCHSSKKNQTFVVCDNGFLKKAPQYFTPIICKMKNAKIAK